MCRILLCAVHSQYIHTSPALASISRYAKARGIRLETAEYNVNQSPDRILQDLYEQKPDILGFSCYLWNIALITSLTAELKTLLPGLRVFLGGPEVSFRPEEVLERIPADYVVTGEGERRVTALLQALLRGEEPEGIDGVFSRQGGVEAPYEDRLLSLSDPAFGPAPELLPDPTRILYYESSRGCPYGCSYCLSCLSKGVRVRDAELVEQDLLRFLEKAPPQVKFIDRTFNFDRARATRLWRFLMDHDNGVTNFHFELNGDLLTPEQLELLSQARPGLFQFEIGLQSTHPETLRAIGRTGNFPKLRENLLALGAKGNIHLHLDLIAGLPYEDYARFGRSFDDAFSCRPHMLQLGFLKVLKGTRMEQDAAAYHIRFRSRPPYEVLDTPWLSYEELCSLKEIEDLLDCYWNSGRYPVSMPYLLERTDSPFRLFESFAEYLRSTAPAEPDFARRLRPKSPEQRRQELLEFVRHRGLCDPELFRDLLLADCYAKELPAKIPPFLQLFGSEPEALAQQSRRVSAFFREGEAARHQPCLAGLGSRELHRAAAVAFFAHDLSKPGYPKGRTALLYQYARKDERGFGTFVPLPGWFEKED